MNGHTPPSLNPKPAPRKPAVKARMDLIPPDALLGAGLALAHGAAKHGDRTWEGGTDWGYHHAALLRHLAAWALGEDQDPDSGLPHLDLALCRLMFLSAYAKRRTGTDDRTRVALFQAPAPARDPAPVSAAADTLDKDLRKILDARVGVGAAPGT